MESQTAGSTGDHPSHHMRWLCPDLPSLVHMVSAVSAIIRPAHTTYAQARVELIECRSWQPDSYGTGGILADDYRTIQWFKINALSGGTSYMPTGLGLRPWYLKGFNPVQPITSVAPAPIAGRARGRAAACRRGARRSGPLPDEALNTLPSLFTLPSSMVEHSRHIRQNPPGSPSPLRLRPRAGCYLSQRRTQVTPLSWERSQHSSATLHALPPAMVRVSKRHQMGAHQAASLQPTTSAHSGSASVRSAACRSMSLAQVVPWNSACRKLQRVIPAEAQFLPGSQEWSSCWRSALM